jgi:hypothetical protein
MRVVTQVALTGMRVVTQDFGRNPSCSYVMPVVTRGSTELLFRVVLNLVTAVCKSVWLETERQPVTSVSSRIYPIRFQLVSMMEIRDATHTIKVITTPISRRQYMDMEIRDPNSYCQGHNKFHQSTTIHGQEVC